jgi:hypothetical protein
MTRTWAKRIRRLKAKLLARALPQTAVFRYGYVKRLPNGSSGERYVAVSKSEPTSIANVEQCEFEERVGPAPVCPERSFDVYLSLEDETESSTDRNLSQIITLTPAQTRVFVCDRRFRAVVAGRRSGKTYLAFAELCRAAMGPGRLAWYVAPSYKMAKRIAWKALKEFTRPLWASPPNETDLRIELIGGGTIVLCGADNFDSLRGVGLNFVVVDEFATLDPEAWYKVLRPALSDRLGGALIIGTPKGHDHFYDLFQDARDQEDWATFQYTTEQGGIVTAEELLAARRGSDERSYREEYQADFDILGTGRVYYAFDHEQNVRSGVYNPAAPLFWALDFNVNPMCSVIGQTINGIVQVLEEMVLPDSHTQAACEEFVARTQKWSTGGLLSVAVYGDASGAHRNTAGTRTDWQIVKNFFNRYPERYRVTVHVPSANPLVKNRTNCVNALLCNHAGQRRLRIAPQCKELSKDFNQVCWKTDAHGNSSAELDKSNPARTHVSDALGYYVAQEFPMRSARGERSGPMVG